MLVLTRCPECRHLFNEASDRICPDCHPPIRRAPSLSPRIRAIVVLAVAMVALALCLAACDGLRDWATPPVFGSYAKVSSALYSR